jgi:hypothetical protein
VAVDWTKARSVLDGLEAGKSLRAAAKEAGTSAPSFIRWTGEDSDLAERYARAREIGYKLLADELVEISDEGSGDAQRDRLRVDTRKWMLAKMLPKIYGERIEHDHKGGVNVTLSRIDNEV